MSKKLKAAMLSGEVSVRSRQTGQVSVWYRNRQGVRSTFLLDKFVTAEIAPKLTDAKMLQWSNLAQLVKVGAIEIL